MMVGVGVITVFHHLIADAWSLSLFISEITDIYSKLLSINNSSFETFTPYPSYSTYIASCEEYEKSERYVKDKDFWTNDFKSFPELTYIYKGSQSTSSNASRKICSFDDVFYDTIRKKKKNHKCSIYTFFMAIFLLFHPVARVGLAGP